MHQTIEFQNTQSKKLIELKGETDKSSYTWGLEHSFFLATERKVERISART